MAEDKPHASAVADWLACVGEGADTAALVALLGAALHALWARANATLGDVTMTVIARRVLHVGVARFPVLRPLALKTAPARLLELDATPLRGADPADVAAAVAFVLTELLTVIGTLTGEVLTPALHAELARVRLPTRPPKAST